MALTRQAPQAATIAPQSPPLLTAESPHCHVSFDVVATEENDGPIVVCHRRRSICPLRAPSKRNIWLYYY